MKIKSFSFEMKRSRSELVSSAVGSFLRRRQYSDSETFKKSDLNIHQVLQEMTLNATVCVGTGMRNAFSYTSISGDATAVDQQYTRLKNFLSEALEPYKSELSYILFPMFIHLYLELVTNGQKTAAQKFHSRHHGLFLHSQEYKSVAESLCSIVTLQDLAKFSTVKEIRENKFHVQLSEDCVEYFLKFLKDNDQLILLQVLNMYFCIEVVNLSDRDSSNLHIQEDSPPIKVSQISSPVCEIKNEKSPKSLTNSKESLEALKQAIKKVSESPPCLPSVCLYTVNNTNQGLSSVSLSQDTTLLAGGFENSSIRLWSLTPKALESVKTDVDVSKVHLGYDILPEDDEMENDVSSSHVKVMRGHGGPVYSLAFVPRSNILLSASEDTTVRAWSMTNHTNIVIYRGHAYPVWSLDIGPLGVYFATASKDHTARIWTTDRTYPLRILAGHNLDVDCVKFHPNGNYVATGSSDRTVRLWSVQDGKMVRMFHGHRGSIFALAFSPNGQYLASAGEDRRIKIWDLSSGLVMKELRGHIDTVYSICFNNDSTVLASGGLEHVLRIWDVRKGITHHGGHTATGSTASTNPRSDRIDSHTAPELLGAFPTKSTSVQLVQYNWHNLLLAVGEGVETCSS
ncbi:TAF5-like RNA polymerase II p300/CBP-associated factor-associated factor 65 kDa subunit 5L [Tachypleus tridentatus]|uniref:TAF5-like RNA polymerase II p300/CBP-associated factor-associated factor 65 kDa subunit 5L n=1 Tax=Tachypleus tridentatus TaxID=6853 RepID=UPI003FD52633